MKNQFCISKEDLAVLFYGETTKTRLDILLKKFEYKYLLNEIEEQMREGKGEVAEYFKGEVRRFSTKTENAEIANAISLADLYLVDLPSQVCFEMKNNFRQKTVKNSEELISNIEPDTEIDFIIKDDKKTFYFQHKQYPEKYKTWSVDEVIGYLEKEILPEHEYNNIGNKDLIIAITIQPEQISNLNDIEDFDKIYEYLKIKEIKLFEIIFLYNRNNESLVLHQVFPRNNHNKISMQDTSFYKARRYPM